MTGKAKINEKSAAVSRSFHLEAYRSRRGMSVCISGVIGIGDFTDECAILHSHSGRIIVEGSRLDVSVYENKTVEISGRVEVITFKYGKN